MWAGHSYLVLVLFVIRLSVPPAKTHNKKEKEGNGCPAKMESIRKEKEKEEDVNQTKLFQIHRIYIPSGSAKLRFRMSVASYVAASKGIW